MGTWTMEQYSIEKLDRDINEGKITVPRFQRGIRWKNSQKEKLIDSMKKGFPFGSILLYEKDNKRQIIDGLQRSTAIIEFVKNPALFFNEDQVDYESIHQIADSFGMVGNSSKIENELKDLMINWVRNNHNSMQDIQRMQYGDLVDDIIEKWPIASEKKDTIKQVVKRIFSDFQDMCANISDIQVPVLVYEGDEALLPEIFERINSQGAKLTKQEIYAATWAHDLVKLDDSQFDDIIYNNRDRYENMLDDNMVLDDYDPQELLKNKEVNIFELVFGFGKMISSKYPFLFTYDKKDKKKVESIGFNLINACLVQKSSNMGQLNVNLKKLIDLETNSIEKFLSRIIEAIEYVDKRLGSGTKFKGNTRSDSNVYPLHTELQIVSIIATVFINKHASFELNDRGEVINLVIDTINYNPEWHNMKSCFDRNILKIYAMDILGQKWKGSGDKRLDNIIIGRNYYNREVSWKDFEQVLDVYYNTMNSERNERKQVATPKESEKLILNLIYSSIFSAADQNDESRYDIEHLAPKNLMKEKMSKYPEDFSLPVSSIANLCLLPEGENRQKKDKTIYQDTKYLSGENIEEIESKFTFTIKSDLAWLDEDLTAENFRNAYMNFLNNRYDKMKDKIRKNLFDRTRY